MDNRKPEPKSAAYTEDSGHSPKIKWVLKDRPDPFRIFLMGAYMHRVMDVLDFYEVLTRTVHVPLLGKYFYLPIINLYGAQYHSGRAVPLRDVVPILEQAKSVAVAECACRVRLDRCGHSTRTCLKINSGAESELKHGGLRSERITVEESVRIVEQAYGDGLMLNVEWCVDPYTYSVCCCCDCCCVQRKLRFQRGVTSGVMPSEYLPRFDMNACAACGDCEKICPGKAISIQDGERTVDEKNCVGCGLCEYHCPAKAIELYEARPAAYAKDRGFFHHFLIYISCYFVLIPYFIVYMLLKGKGRERAREVEW